MPNPFLLGEEDGYNIPEVRACHELPRLLTEEGYHKLYVGAELSKDMKRFFGDPYMCFYRPTHNRV